MPNQKIDITGRVYGDLTALYPDPNYTGNKGKWIFRCSCGKEKSIFKTNVLSGSTTQCHPRSEEYYQGRTKEKYDYIFSQIDLDSCTPRQKQIIELFKSGLTQREVAEKLHLNQSTISKHLNGSYNPVYDRSYGGIMKKTTSNIEMIKSNKQKEDMQKEVISKQKIVDNLLKQRDAQRVETNQLSQLIRDLQDEIENITREIK